MMVDSTYCIAKIRIVKDVPRDVHINFLKVERSLHRRRIHATEELAVEEGGGVEMHVLEDVGHWTFSAVGMNPTIMVVSLAVAILAAIKVAGHESNDIYLFEIKKINANGGAITIVHLLGATGKGRREGEDKHKLRFPKHIKIKIVRGNNWTGSCVNFDEFLRNPGNGGGFLKLYESNDRPNLPRPP
ncbi:3-ketoacyl-CoA thiolase 1, peroxisomal-like isoform X1 [Cucumis melo var. makuwa]|uniref:3-ketoacyl-CoA thiolase 1, peroxisomal-like isoform X1 n=1 Tax=Cucumis melo var. makuwa TaxID=1194695 RepID=A0A5D3C3L8_CUCMM|nr:3-ketoacyl-CoA thiolase 1, peroxisomal-like isoform X1 [Cucumis melo var. makuwa]TYK05904.1 3-ketoacyl-CoA thiolase 1, peroxisomal-like isoform X1 [Cucumis melo var. makuwa]